MPVQKSSHYKGWNKFINGHAVRMSNVQALITLGKRTEEAKQNLSRAMIKSFKRSSHKEKHRAAITAIMQKPEVKEHLRQRAFAQLSNHESRARWYAGSNSDRANQLRSEAMSRRISNGEIKNFGKHGKFTSFKMRCAMSYDSTFERRFMAWCEQSPHVQVFATYKFHKIRIPYFNPVKQRAIYYYPDFLIQLSSGQTLLCEVKPEYLLGDPQVKAKAQAAIELCKELGHKYCFVTEITLATLESAPLESPTFQE